ncbi:MAG: CHAT domain-containing protein, partial [Bacteroidetes bacterium]|nr:CHAT domain-containing protein [Bacteroidota bacterium]
AITWEDVRNSLSPGEAAIEFVRFDYSHAVKTDTAWYAAMIVRPQDTAPIFVKLCEERQLAGALKAFAYKAPANGRGVNKGNTGTRPAGNTIYKLIWQPLEPYLAGTKTLFFSPDGMLHQIAFAAITCKKDSLMCDKYNLVQLTSTRQIATHDNERHSGNTIALFGGINYNQQSSNSSQNGNADLYAYGYRQNRGAGADSFRFLPNTLNEVTVIENEMTAAKRKAVLFTGAQATEQAFCQLGVSASPNIIHFATHGFTLSGATPGKDAVNAFQTAVDPLLRCGLVMAGGNNGWKGRTGPDEDDGILTGLEISAVPLTNTDLVVLSACETALGQLGG